MTAQQPQDDKGNIKASVSFKNTTAEGFFAAWCLARHQDSLLHSSPAHAPALRVCPSASRAREKHSEHPSAHLQPQLLLGCDREVEMRLSSLLALQCPAEPSPAKGGSGPPGFGPVGTVGERCQPSAGRQEQEEQSMPECHNCVAGSCQILSVKCIRLCNEFNFPLIHILIQMEILQCFRSSPAQGARKGVYPRDLLAPWRPGPEILLNQSSKEK